MATNEVGKPKPNLEELKYSQNKAAVQDAYQGLLDKKPNAEEVFYRTIINFAKGKISSHIWDLPESVDTPDDYAQKVAIDVWKTLHTFKGEPDGFYSWLHRIVYATGCDAFNEIKEETDNKVPLFVESEDGSGDMIDNPLLYGEDTPEPRKEIPDFIQGKDLRICKYIRSGYTYKQTANIMGLTEKAVELRVARMRKKVESMNLPEKRAEFFREQDRLWNIAAGKETDK